MSENNHILDDRRPGLYIFSARQQGYQKIKRKRASLFALEKGEEHPGKGNNLGKGLRVIVTVAGGGTAALRSGGGRPLHLATPSHRENSRAKKCVQERVRKRVRCMFFHRELMC